MYWTQTSSFEKAEATFRQRVANSSALLETEDSFVTVLFSLHSVDFDDSHQLSARDKRTPHLFHAFGKLRLMFIAGLVLLPQLLSAQWNATVGAQSHDLGRQGLAFLPNEIWIHAGDSITWTVTAGEPHTVTFLTDGQIRPSFSVGCPGFSTGSAIFDGSTCVTSAILFKGSQLTVAFPVADLLRRGAHTPRAEVTEMLSKGRHVGLDFYDLLTAALIGL